MKVHLKWLIFAGENLVEDFSRVVEENKRLQSMLEEKDRRIHLLEFKVNQLMKDTLTISEENSRYQKENSTLGNNWLYAIMKTKLKILSNYFHGNQIGSTFLKKKIMLHWN